MARYNKALIAVLGFVLTVLATVLGLAPGLIPIEYLPYVHVVLAVGTTYGVYQVKNNPPV